MSSEEDGQTRFSDARRGREAEARKQDLLFIFSILE
jgi:hypothetical protein